MNCKICGCPDPGNHNQPSCCRPCAAFFRRTIQLKIRYRCNKSGKCTITKENRFFCRYCRMKRCIAVGMISEDTDTPKDFYLEACRFEPSNCESTMPSPPNYDNLFYTETNVIENYDDFIVEFKQRIYEMLAHSPQESKFSFELSLFQQAALAFSEHRKKWPNCTKEKLLFAEVHDLNAAFCDMFRELQNIAEFCMGIKAFSRIPLQDKGKIISRFSSYFVHFERIFVAVDLLGTEDDSIWNISYNGHVINVRKTPLDVSKLSDCPPERYEGMVDHARTMVVAFVLEFRSLNPDKTELCYMFLTSLFNVQGLDDLSEETLQISEQTLDRLAEELYFYYKFEKKIPNFAARVYKMHNLISAVDRINEERAHQCQMVKIFELFNFDVHFESIKEWL